MCVADQSVDIELFWVAVPLLAKWLFKKKQNPVDRVLKEEKKKNVPLVRRLIRHIGTRNKCLNGGDYFRFALRAPSTMKCGNTK